MTTDVFWGMKGALSLDIVRFKGGLGNQMFQYAFFKALCERGRNVWGSLGFYSNHPEARGFYLPEAFPRITIPFVEDEVFDEWDERWKAVKADEEVLKDFLQDYPNRFFWVESEDCEYEKHVFDTRNCAYVGYWQSEKYFYDIKDIILSDFTFKKGDVEFEKLKAKLREGGNYISVHIRRGDYLKYSDVYVDLFAAGYYRDAREYMNEKIDEPTYVYFSDDIQWVKENIRDDRGIFIEASMFEDYQAWYDMCLMSCCAHNIIANSSYSWWGAWLNPNPEKIVTAPCKWVYINEMRDVCPDRWHRI